MTSKILNIDARELSKHIEPNSVHCCVTSPPYYKLRSYLPDESELKSFEIGQEPTVQEYIDNLVLVFREVWKVLRDDGTLWLNIGDSYSGGGRGGNSDIITGNGKDASMIDRSNTQDDLPPKNLIGIPWRVAFALQADGWYLRQDIIWSKPNPMPESVKDRCTKSHEYIFLLSKSPQYYYDQEAIKEPMKDASMRRLMQDIENQAGSERVPGKTNGTMKAVGNCKNWKHTQAGGGKSWQGHSSYFKADGTPVCRSMVNKKSVWTVTTKPHKFAHFAVYPEELIEPCILAGCPVGGTVLDPFSGSHTTGRAAIKNGRNYIGCDLNPEYVDMKEDRLTIDVKLF